MVTLLRYLPGAALYICGGALILSGGMAVLVEFLLNLTFGLHETFLWSFYPLAAGVVLGAMLLVIAMCKPCGAACTVSLYLRGTHADDFYRHRQHPAGF